MNTPASIVVDRIVEDRIQLLIKLLKDHPPHRANTEFNKRTGVPISNIDMASIYKMYIPESRYCWTVTHKALKKFEYWKDIEQRIKEKTSKDVADFIYSHWKKELDDKK